MHLLSTILDIDNSFYINLKTEIIKRLIEMYSLYQNDCEYTGFHDWCIAKLTYSTPIIKKIKSIEDLPIHLVKDEERELLSQIKIMNNYVNNNGKINWDEYDPRIFELWDDFHEMLKWTVIFRMTCAVETDIHITNLVDYLKEKCIFALNVDFDKSCFTISIHLTESISNLDIMNIPIFSNGNLHENKNLISAKQYLEMLCNMDISGKALFESFPYKQIHFRNKDLSKIKDVLININLRFLDINIGNYKLIKIIKIFSDIYGLQIYNK